MWGKRIKIFIIVLGFVVPATVVLVRYRHYYEQTKQAKAPSIQQDFKEVWQNWAKQEDRRSAVVTLTLHSHHSLLIQLKDGPFVRLPIEDFIPFDALVSLAQNFKDNCFASDSQPSGGTCKVPFSIKSVLSDEVTKCPEAGEARILNGKVLSKPTKNHIVLFCLPKENCRKLDGEYKLSLLSSATADGLAIGELADVIWQNDFCLNNKGVIPTKEVVSQVYVTSN